MRLCLCLCLCLLAGAAAHAQTVDELVAKNIEAKGGLAKLRSVQTVKQTSEMKMQDRTTTLVVYGKRPNLVRQEISVNGQTVVSAFDGQVPWMINPLVGTSAPMVVTGPQADAIREQAYFDGPLVDYKARGFRLELVGAETVASRKVYHLKVTDRNQQVQQVYLDADTGLEMRIVSEVNGAKFEQDLSDYRDVDGVKVPFAIRMSSNGVQQSQITVSKVEMNVKIDDSLFKAPAAR